MKLQTLIDINSVEYQPLSIFYFNFLYENKEELINDYPNFINLVADTQDKAFEYDLQYSFKSGQKKINNFLYKKYDYLLRNSATEKSAIESLLIIILALSKKYMNKWEEMIINLNLEYNPLDNYNMKEHEETNVNMINSSSINEDTDNDSVSSKYGYNSNNAKDDAKVTSTINSTSEATSTTEGSKDDNYKDVTRSGNIGVTTSQQMLESELILRSKYIINDIIFRDLDEVICLQVY